MLLYFDLENAVPPLMLLFLILSMHLIFLFTEILATVTMGVMCLTSVPLFGSFSAYLSSKRYGSFFLSIK